MKKISKISLLAIKFFRWVRSKYNRLHDRLGVLGMKMLGKLAIMLISSILVLLIRFTAWKWPLYLIFAGIAYAAIRLIGNYYWHSFKQELLNGWHSLLNEIRKDSFYKLEEENRMPFECANCRKPKKYYEEFEDEENNFPGKKICKMCVKHSFPMRVIVQHKIMEQDTGSESYFPQHPTD